MKSAFWTASKTRAAAAGVSVRYVQGTGLSTLSDLAPIPAFALQSGAQPGLSGEYFTNQDLQGAPTITRQDAQIRFNWSVTPPPGLPHDHYSVRWTGQLIAPRGGEYTLGVRGDDGFRLFLRDQKVIDDWTIHPAETKTCTVTLKAGQSVPLRLEYYQGDRDAEVSLLWKAPGDVLFGDALAAAQRTDAVIFVGGISSQLEGEEGTNGNGDRADLNLPAVQQQLLEALSATGKPIIVVLMNGSALGVNWAQAHVPAIVEAWYPGEEGGTALAAVLFGDYNPSGRLPVTFYTGVDQLPPFRDYAMKNRTYRYFGGKPLYPFGYGLSYTQFQYSNLKMPKQIRSGQSVTVTAEIENIGARAGDEVVELYLRPAPNAAAREIAPGQPMPRLLLAGFARVSLGAHQRRTVSFPLSPEQLLLVNARGERALQPGAWQVFVGGVQPDLARWENVLSGKLTVR